MVHIGVRDFVREKRSNMERVTTTDLAYFLLPKNFIATPVNNLPLQSNKSIESNIPIVQRWLTKNGFKRGVKSGSLGMKPMFFPGETHTCVNYLPIDKTRKRTSCKKFIWMNHIFTNIIVSMKILFFDPNDEQDLEFGNFTKGEEFVS